MNSAKNELSFRPDDYPGLDSFRRGYAAIYAQSLGDGSPVRVEGSLTREQQEIATRLQQDAQRGERSIRREVRATSRGCSFKRHFTGCMRELIGMAEKLAAKDSDRFVWNHKWTQAKKGRKGTDGDYKRTQKLRCLQLLEGFGILTPARRLRNGVYRYGWDVASHSKLSEVVGGQCRLNVSRCVISPRRRGEGMEEFLTRTITNVVAEGIKSEVEGITEGIIEGIRIQPEGITEGITEGIRIVSRGDLNSPQPTDEEVVGESEKTKSSSYPSHPSYPSQREPSQPSQPDPASAPKPVCNSIFGLFESQPPDASFYEELARISVSDQPRDLSFSDSVTQSFKTKSGQSSSSSIIKKKIIPDLESIVEQISYGAFDVACLSRFRHQKELLACCERAQRDCVGSSSGDPAAVMGKAMELLRNVYQKNAPGGWLPVMKKLRKKSAAY